MTEEINFKVIIKDNIINSCHFCDNNLNGSKYLFECLKCNKTACYKCKFELKFCESNCFCNCDNCVELYSKCIVCDKDLQEQEKIQKCDNCKFNTCNKCNVKCKDCNNLLCCNCISTYCPFCYVVCNNEGCFNEGFIYDFNDVEKCYKCEKCLKYYCKEHINNCHI